MRLFFLTIAIGLGSLLIGQKPFYYKLNNKEIQIDTVSLDNVEDFGMEDFVINLGNHGSPEFNLKPELNDLIMNDYSVLTFQPSHQFKRYKLFTPIVDAKYVVGAGQEQHFNLLHSQNIKEKVNYSIGLDKINSKGIYQNQETSYTDIFFNIYGKDLWKNRYDYNVEFNYLNAAASLNGGLEDDSTFIDDTLDLQNRELLEVNLLYGYQELKKWYGHFDHQVTLFDNLDSSNNGSEIKLINSFEYEHNSRLFYDSLLNTNFYDRILDDSTVTNEIMTYQNLNGYLGIGYSKKGKTLLNINAGVTTSYVDYRQVALDTFRWDIEAKIKGEYVAEKLIIRPEISYLVNDQYDNNDYNFDLKAKYYLGNLVLKASVYLSNERPQLDLLNYSSNHVSWNNSFEKYQIQHFKLAGEYYGQKWESAISLNYFDVRNPIYFGYDKTPYQAPGVAQLIRTSISAKIVDHKRWDLSGEAHYQYLGGYNVFRLPNVIAKVSAAFKFKAFKKKMAAAIGADLTYFSKYESKHFDPVSGQFYIYSNGELGNYPYVNVFLKSRVQRATFFVMMSHPHQGLFGYNYFYAPGYPANDRFFRIGVSWLFVN